MCCAGMPDVHGQTVLGYRLVRSDRKTVGLTVSRAGEVVIRAPRRLPLAQIEETVRQNRDWLEAAVARVRSAPPLPDADRQKQLRERAKQVLPALVARWAARTGLHPTSLRVTAAKGRFGSCSGRNGVCFSLFLMQYPSEAVEYVVVHELCHIRHHNHSREFWALVGQYLPDYRERKALLQQPPGLDREN